MEINKKEFTHNCAQSTKKCHSCAKMFSCEKCRGVCIFSKGFLKKYSETKILKKFVDERFYKNEFTIIRQIAAEIQLENEEVETDGDEILGLFSLFHSKFDRYQRQRVFEFHTGPFHHTTKGEVHHKSSLSRKIVELYDHRHYKEYNQNESRQKRQTGLIKDSISNIYLI